MYTSESELCDLERFLHSLANRFGNVTFNDFKKVFRVKETKIARRLFDIFDSRNSGTASISSIVCHFERLQRAGPQETLKFLFDLHDSNSDGFITVSGLQDVVAFCVRDSALEMDKNIIDQVTLALYNDTARNRQSDLITLASLEQEICRYPGLVDNLKITPRSLINIPKSKTLSTAASNRRSRCCNCNPCALANNKSIIVFFTVYAVISAILVISTTSSMWGKKSSYIILARAFGACLNFNSILVALFMLKYCLTWLRSTWLRRFVPIDQHIEVHRFIGYMIFVLSLAHTGMHIGNFIEITIHHNHDVTSYTLFEYLFSTKPGIGWVQGSACITGWILLAVLIIMILFSLPFIRKSGHFEIFYWSHTLYSVYWIVLILHGPSFWKWFALPGSMFIVEKILRSRWVTTYTYGETFVEEVVILPSKVTHLVINRPANLIYQPGDYIYLNIPLIARYEWHPFTISSAPENEDVIWLHVRAVGNWTNKLYEYFEKELTSTTENSVTSFTKRRKSSSTSDSPLEKNFPVELVKVNSKRYRESMATPLSILKKHDREYDISCIGSSRENLYTDDNFNDAIAAPNSAKCNLSSLFHVSELDTTEPQRLDILESSRDKKVSFADDAGLLLKVPFTPSKPDVLRGNYRSFLNRNTSQLSDTVFEEEEIGNERSREVDNLKVGMLPDIQVVNATPDNPPQLSTRDIQGDFLQAHQACHVPGHVTLTSTPYFLERPTSTPGNGSNRTASSILSSWLRVSKGQNLAHVNYTPRRFVLRSSNVTLDGSRARIGLEFKTPTVSESAKTIKKSQQAKQCAWQANVASQLKHLEDFSTSSSTPKPSVCTSLLDSLQLTKEMKVYIDGPYGSPTAHIFQVEHAVLIGGGIGVTPYASILQSIMHRYLQSRQTCPNCQNSWTGFIPPSIMRLKKVDFFWISREQISFEWFISLLSQLEIEQAQLGSSLDKFLHMHMYMTSVPKEYNIRGAMMQMALDLIHKKELRDLITGLKTKTKTGRPNWNEIFIKLSREKKGKVTVFCSGASALTQEVQARCQQFGFQFKKEIF